MRMEALDAASRLLRQRARIDRLRPESEPIVYDPGPLLDFVPALSPQYQAPVWLAPIAEEMERVAECIRVGDPEQTVEACISVGPGHAKSTLALHFIPWLLVQFPELTILYLSYSHDVAVLQTEIAKQLCVEAGVTLGDVDTKELWTTSSGGSVTAAGLGGPITGRRWRVVIVDDPHKNRREAESKRIREGVTRGFFSDAYTRDHPLGTHFLVIHTRWHVSDLIGVLTKPQSEDDEAEGAVRPFKYFNLQSLRADGTALAPSLFSAARLRKKRQRLGQYEFDSLYQGHPRPKGGALFGDVALIDTLETTGSFRYAIGIDLARTARTRSDYQVAVVMRINTATKNIDVVEVLRHQGTLSDRVEGRGEAPVVDDGFIKKLHQLSKRYPNVPIYMYTARDETLMIALMGRHNTWPVQVRAIDARTRGDKWERAAPYADAWNDPNGRLRIPRDARWADDFIAEHIDFTSKEGERDDQVDAAAAAFDALQVASGGRPQGTGEGSTAHRIRNSITI
jgi:hypothetical protein